MSIYNVDKNVPIPPMASPGNLKYPWTSMDAGDSSLIPYDGSKKETQQASVGSSAREWLKRHKPEFMMVTRRSEEGIRVWFIDKEPAP